MVQRALFLFFISVLFVRVIHGSWSRGLRFFVGTYVCMPSSMVALRASHISPTVAVWNACSNLSANVLKCCLSPCVFVLL